MGSRGRKSAAELGVIQGIPERPKPPDELTSAQAEEWRAVVARMPVNWFPREIWPLLTQYCRHICNARHIARLIEAAHDLDIGDRTALMRFKPKAKPKITAKEKKNRELRRGFEKVCDLIADGPKASVKEITVDKSIGISRSGFYYLLKGRDAELLDRYAQARAMQADRLAGEIISIADGASKDTVNQARLQFDARRWMAGKLAPKTYGDKQTIDVNQAVQDSDEIIARAKQAAERLGITLPLYLLGRVEKGK